MSCIERADAADPSYIYIYVHERGCNQPPSNFLLPPPEFIEIVISESDWIFLDDLGRIERDQCLGIRGSLSRSSVRNLALPPINERNRESPPLLERVIQIDDQISFFFFFFHYSSVYSLFQLVKFHPELLSVMCSFNGSLIGLVYTRWSILICRWIRVESIRETRWMQVRV